MGNSTPPNKRRPKPYKSYCMGHTFTSADEYKIERAIVFARNFMRSYGKGPQPGANIADTSRYVTEPTPQLPPSLSQKKRESISKRRWHDSEIELIRRYFPRYGSKYVATLIGGISYQQVSAKATQLNLRLLTKEEIKLLETNN